MENILWQALFSGAFAAGITLLYTYLHDKKVAKSEKEEKIYNYKLSVFQNIMGYRGQLSGDHGKELQVAMNQVFIAFQDSKKVLECFKTFQEKAQAPIINSKGDDQDTRSQDVIRALIYLLKAMCDDLQIKYNFMNEELFTKPLMLGQENFPTIILDAPAPVKFDQGGVHQ